MRPRTLAVAAAAAFLCSPLAAQAPGHAPGDWQRVETEHFLFLFPQDLREWTLAMAGQMEAVHEAVTGLIGHVPSERVTVLVDDPGNVSNGSTNPGPLLYVWPTPPDARSMVGDNRGWGEILAVHELAHAVHLTRPTRNPARRFLWSLAPIPMTPLMLGTPRWLTEGYATWVEGILTGSGRPHGVWRPAVLRTWALEGQLPTYGAVSGTGGYLGGAMAYLVGSAYVEWLVEKEGRGGQVLTELWARMTAREARGFPEAFTGVFGAPPDDLYGRFMVEVTDRALAVRREIEEAGGVAEGDLFQRLTWTPGEPAVSPDGERIALVLSSQEGPSRLVVISSRPDTVPAAERERLAEILRKDPQDVAPVRRLPRAQEAEATLWPDFGHPYGRPRWLPDGKGILVTRDVAVGNEQLRPELFLWEWETGQIRQITHDEAIREGDPAPDGTWAAGLRCLGGRCDIVRVELGSGAVTTLARSDLLSPYSQPRVSPDGTTIVAARQVEGVWRIVAMEADGSRERLPGPDDGAARFGAAFLPPGGDLVLTSTRGGIANLEILDLATGEARPLTRSLGAAVAPTPASNGDVFFLSLHSRGWDLRRIRADQAAGILPHVDAGLSPAAQAGPEEAPTFPTGTLEPARAYGPGPRLRSWLPMASFAQEGHSGGLVLSSTDPIGRLTWQLKGIAGDEGAWRGGSFDLLWRGSRPRVLLEGFLADGPLPREAGAAALEGYRELTKGYYGGLAALEMSRVRDRGSLELRLGGAAGRLEEANRTLGFASLELAARQSPGRGFLGQSVHLEGATGSTGGLDWTRWLATGSLEVGGPSSTLFVSGTLGRVDAPAESVEGFQVGGTEPLLLDPGILSQRVAMPALPPDFLRGAEVATARVELRSVELGNLFFWAGNAANDGEGWYRMVGTEISADAHPLPYLRIPSVIFRTGSAYLLDNPHRGAWRWWLSLGWRP